MATLHAIDNRKFICGECKMKYKGTGYAMEQATKHRSDKGCFKPSAIVLHKIKDIHFKSCVGNFFDYSALSLLDAHDKLEKGILPFPGSYMDQPAKVMEVFKLISNHKADQILEANKAQTKKASGPQPRSVRRG